MDITQFAIQMNRLEGVWPKAYPREKTQIIWAAVKHATEDALEGAVTRLLSSSRWAPLPQDVIAAMPGLRRYTSFEDPEPCSYCDSSGVILALKLDTCVNVAFNCKCVNSEKWPYKPWHRDLESLYRPDYIWNRELKNRKCDTEISTEPIKPSTKDTSSTPKVKQLVTNTLCSLKDLGKLKSWNSKLLSTSRSQE